jgi:hypothetical protein
MLIDDAIAPSIPRTPRAARAGRAVRAVRRSWWRWLDFDSELLAQVWVICCTQILILAVAGLVIHASAASPY